MNERIKQLRKTLNLTQQEFADRLGIKRGGVANYEMGRNNPIDAVISLICREFNVNEDWLKNGTGEMFIEKSTFSLDEYADVHKLTESERAIVRGFMELEPDARTIVCRAVYHVFKQLFETNDELFPPTPENDKGANID